MQVDDVGGPSTPSCLYNAMINPLVGMTVRAALWYQGESNVGQGRDAYVCNLVSMIQVSVGVSRRGEGVGSVSFVCLINSRV